MEPARATLGATIIHPWTCVGERAATGTGTIAVTVNVTITVVAVTSGGGKRACASAAERGGEVFGRNEVQEECRMLVVIIRAQDGDLVERAWSEPRLDHAPDGGEGCWCVDDD